MSLARELWARRGEHPAFVALAAATAAALLVWPAVDVYLREIGVATPFGFNDYGVYAAARNTWAEGGPIYTPNEGGGYHGSYLYPPVTLLWFVLFAGFGFKLAAVLLGTVSLLLLWVGLELVARVLGYDLLVWERLALLVALFGFQPALRDFKWAQIATLLTAALCVAFYAHERGAEARPEGRWIRCASGALTTLGSAFKLFFAPAGAHLLRDRDRFLGAMATAGGLLVVSVAVFGIDTHRAYVDVLLWGKGWGRVRALYLWDTAAAYHPLHFLDGLGMPVRALGMIGVIGLTLATRGVETASARRATFALGVAGVPLFAPRADVHDLTVMLLPAVILLAIELDRPRGYPSIPVASVLLLHFHRYGLELAVNPPGWMPLGEAVRQHAAWFQLGMWATYLLVGLAAYRVAEHVGRPAIARASLRERS